MEDRITKGENEGKGLRCGLVLSPWYVFILILFYYITAVTNNNDNHVFLILEAEAEAEAEAIDESRVFRLLVFHSLNGQSAHQ